jgi:hypothetical protein
MYQETIKPSLQQCGPRFTAQLNYGLFLRPIAAFYIRSLLSASSLGPAFELSVRPALEPSIILYLHFSFPAHASLPIKESTKVVLLTSTKNTGAVECVW